MMDNMYFKIASIQKKMEQNRNLQFIIKGVAALTVFTIFLCSLNYANTMEAVWIRPLLCICVFFGINVFYIYQHKKLEYKMYECEKEDLASKKRIAEIKGEVLPDTILNRYIKEASKEISIPIVYYRIMMLLDMLVGVLLIRYVNVYSM